MSITIRQAQATDINQMSALLQTLFSIEADFIFDADLSQSALQKIIDDSERCALVASNGRKIIGMCSAQWVYSTASGKKSAWIEDVVLHPDFRGQGIGTKMMDELLVWCRDSGCNRAQLVYDLDNQPAIDFYQKQAFSSTRLGVFSKTL